MSRPAASFRALTAALLLPALAASPLRAAESTTTTYSEATVRAMWIRLLPEPVGGTSPFTVRVSPNKTGDAAVGLIEHILGGAGDTWKSSAWIAAVAASNTRNVLLTDNEFLLKVRGFIDGPSAGMLMAATMLALMRGDTLRENVTITGTVNPDGTIGPVAGINFKMEGAKRAGIKEIGYPLIDDGDPEQLIAGMKALGEQHGIKTVPVGDIFQAYELLTGKSLGRPVPLEDTEMKFSAAQESRIAAAAQALLAEAKTRLEATRELQKKVAKPPASFKADLSTTADYIAEAEKFLTEKSVMMGHSRAVMADGFSRMAEKSALWQAPLSRNDDRSLLALYDAAFAGAETQLAALTSALSTHAAAPTLAGRISGFHGQLQSWVVRSQLVAATAGKADLEARKFALRDASQGKIKATAAELRELSKGIAETMLETVMRLAIIEGRARSMLDVAKFPGEEDTTPAPDLNPLYRRLAEAYGPAAAAGLAYFQSTVVRNGYHRDHDPAFQRRSTILSRDIAYTSCAEAAAHAIRISEDGGEELPAAVLDRLACGAHAYLGMAALMNKYYNLAEEPTGPDAEKHATTVTLRKGQTVTRMMESSRRRVLEEAALVKKQISFIPESIKMNFNLAETKRHDPSDLAKLDALTSYWRAHFLCRMAQMMGKAK